MPLQMKKHARPPTHQLMPSLVFAMSSAVGAYMSSSGKQTIENDAIIRVANMWVINIPYVTSTHVSYFLSTQRHNTEG